MSENPMRDRLKAACSEFESAAVKPTINKLAKQFDLHPQILTGALMAYEAIPDPKVRGPRADKRNPRSSQELDAAKTT